MYVANIISENTITVEYFKKISKPEIIFESLDKDSIFIERNIITGYLSITSIGKDTINLYELEEQNIILNCFHNPSFFLIQFDKFEYFKKFISKFSSLNILIDNDYGKLLKHSEVINLNLYEEFIAVT